MESDERYNVILTFARTLFVNGQATDQTLAAAERLGRAFGLRAKLMARWGELQLQSGGQDASLVCLMPADPTGVNMKRVASTMRAIEEVESSVRPSPGAAMSTINTIALAPPAPTWLFALAAGAGAVALSVIFGVDHFVAALLIFVSAGVGAILRRALGQLSENVFLQPFGAALLAGLIGALAVRYDLSSSLRLVAVCPCMVLVPGPHFLNSALDLNRGAHPSRSGPTRLCHPYCCRNLDGVAGWPGNPWRFSASRSPGASCSLMAGCYFRRRGGRFLQHFLLHAANDAAVAVSGGHARARTPVGGA